MDNKSILVLGDHNRTCIRTTLTIQGTLLYNLDYKPVMVSQKEAPMGASLVLPRIVGRMVLNFSSI